MEDGAAKQTAHNYPGREGGFTWVRGCDSLMKMNFKTSKNNKSLLKKSSWADTVVKQMEGG